MSGNKSFIFGAQKLAFGESLASKLLKQPCPRLASIQTISGSGACSLACHFLQQFCISPILYIPDPSWICHGPMASHAQLEVRKYRYLHDKKDLRGKEEDCWVKKSSNYHKPRLDIDGMLSDLGKAPVGSSVLLHLCCHNPTGIDPTIAQWHNIAQICEKRKLNPFFDNAYQGFASGDLYKDATPLRLFIEHYGLFPIVACSFSKIMGLYSERVGVLHVITPHNKADIAKCCLSQLELLARCQYSSPPAFGAIIASRIMGDDVLRCNWEQELRGMFQRIAKMRILLRKHLEKKMDHSNWSHVTDQVGMFSYSGLSEEQVKYCADTYGVFMLTTGRICIAGLNIHNVEHTADAIVAAIKACPLQCRNSCPGSDTSKRLLDIFLKDIKNRLLSSLLFVGKKDVHSSHNILIMYLSIVLSIISYTVLLHMREYF